MKEEVREVGAIEEERIRVLEVQVQRLRTAQLLSSVSVLLIAIRLIRIL